MAAKLKTSITLSEDQLIKLDQIVIATRWADPSVDTYASTVIGQLIDARYETLKSITPVRDGKKIIGWMACYGDHLVCQTDGAGSKDACSRRLDSWVREELSK